jgi:peroxiredoxin
MIRTIALLMAIAVVFVASGTARALDIGDKAPNFTATGVDGKELSLESISNKGDLVVVCFTCNQCPVAVAYEDRLIEFNNKYKDKNVQLIALNCNNKTEGLEVMKQRAEEKGFNFVYAFDESGNAAEAYGAKVTPELFVIKDGKIAYHGAFDDSMKEPSKTYLLSAVDSLLADQAPEVAETKAFGCSIKRK